ncbi:hypothetical protein EW145_g7399, partial [Phellinidium pouzarii]
MSPVLQHAASGDKINAFSHTSEEKQMQTTTIKILNSEAPLSLLTSLTSDGTSSFISSNGTHSSHLQRNANDYCLATGLKPHDTGFKLSNSCIDDDRPFKVVVIGAGFSGIMAGIRFSQRMNNLNLTIYEKNAGVGGTWLTNRYPGVACDVPAHCYQLSFENHTQWSSLYSPAVEIHADMERVVNKYKLMRYIKLQHELIHAQYDEDSGKWYLKLRRPVFDSISPSADE